jgi:pimeloyl-ACP methyl ester carboxylesterase
LAATFGKRIFTTPINFSTPQREKYMLKSAQKNLYLKDKSARKTQTKIEKQWNIKVDDFTSSYVAKKINIPVLIVHDTKDGDIPVSCAYKIRQNLKNGSLLITHGLGHTKILRNQEVVNKSVEFIIQNT